MWGWIAIIICGDVVGAVVLRELELNEIGNKQLVPVLESVALFCRVPTINSH